MGYYDRDYLRGVALTTALLTLPSISVGMAWLFFIAPLPLIYFPIALGFDKGFKIILHATLISCGLALLNGTIAVLFISLSLMPAGFILARCLNRKESIHQAFAKGTVTLGLTWLLAGVLISTINQVNLYQEVLHQIDTGLVEAYDTYSKAPEVSLDAKAELQTAFARIREVTPKILPGVLVTMTFSTVFFNMLLANWLLKKKEVAAWGDLSRWRLPESFVWVFILGGILLFLPGAMNTVGMNLLIITVTLYFFQGFEVFNHLCLRWSVPNTIRVLLIFFLVIQAYGFILLALLGLADIWADFRTPKTIHTE
jgi:uncharacterized protein YybS (DUF2232 family)